MAITISAQGTRAETLASLRHTDTQGSAVAEQLRNLAISILQDDELHPHGSPLRYRVSASVEDGEGAVSLDLQISELVPDPPKASKPRAASAKDK